MKRSWQSIIVNGVLRLLVRLRFRANADPIESREQALRSGARLAQKQLTNTVTEQVSMGGVPALKVSLPDPSLKQRTGKVLLYLHGGGFYLPAMSLHTQYVQMLAEKLQCQVFMPDYRLVPEHAFPAAAEDCLASYRYLLEQGYAADDIVLAGDSAGGNLSLVTVMSARDSGLPLPAGAALLSPATDCLFRGPAYRRNRHRDPLFSVTAVDWMLKNYVRKDQYRDPKASPLYGSFAGLPPLQFHVGSTELLLDSSILADRKARRQGVRSTVHVWYKMPHVFPLISFLPEARQATEQIIEFIQQCWAERSASGNQIVLESSSSNTKHLVGVP